MAQWMETATSRSAMTGNDRFNLPGDTNILDVVTLLDMDEWDVDISVTKTPSQAQNQGPSTAAATKRSRRRLPPEERAQRRRKQHRELVARGRAQAKNCINQLREQERVLQRAIQGVIDQYVREQRKTSTSCSGVRTDGAVGSLRERFIEAVVLSESIHRDNVRLAEEVETRGKYQQIVTSTLNAIETEPKETAQGKVADNTQLLHRPGEWMFFADDDVPFYFEPYTEVQCDELMAQTYANAQRLQNAFDILKYPTMAVRCFGWNVLRMLDETSSHKLRFHFSKQFSTTNSSKLREDLASQTWSILNTPQQYAKLYRHKMVEQLLQRVGDHTSIIVRNNPTTRHALSLRSFNMMRAITDVDARGRRRTHVLTLVLGPQDVEGISQQAAKGIVYISSGFTYISMVELDATTLEVSYGGKGDVVSHEHAAYLLSEIGCTWLRWENMVLPQRLLASE